MVEAGLERYLLKLATQNIAMDDVLYQDSPLRNPELSPNPVKVSLTPLWKPRSWASLTISSVSGWALRRSIKCLTLYGTSTLESLSPQCHIRLSSSKTLNFCFWDSACEHINGVRHIDVLYVLLPLEPVQSLSDRVFGMS